MGRRQGEGKSLGVGAEDCGRDRTGAREEVGQGPSGGQEGERRGRRERQTSVADALQLLLVPDAPPQVGYLHAPPQLLQRATAPRVAVGPQTPGGGGATRASQIIGGPRQPTLVSVVTEGGPLLGCSALCWYHLTLLLRLFSSPVSLLHEHIFPFICVFVFAVHFIFFHFLSSLFNNLTAIE